MATFRYRAYQDKTGKLLTGSIDASSLDEAVRIVARNGSRPFELAEIGSRGLFTLPEIRFGQGGKINLARLFSDLDVLLISGFTIDAALTAVAAGVNGRARRDTIHLVLEHLKSGGRLVEAFAKIPGLRPDILALLDSAESSGKIATVVHMTAASLAEEEKQKQALIEAMIYPAFLLVTLVFAIGVITFFLVPSLSPIFENAPENRPAMLTILSFVRSLFVDNSLLLIALAILLVLAGIFLHQNRQARDRISRIMLSLPFAGKIIRARALAKYLQILALLTGNGVHMKNALELAVKACPIRTYHPALLEIRNIVVQGGAFRDAAKASALFDDSSLALVSIGEDANRLPEALGRAAFLLQSAASRQVNRGLTFLTPAITILMGSIVGGLVVSVMNAILSINNLALK
jgi:general secretion pathway protein F